LGLRARYSFLGGSELEIGFWASEDETSSWSDPGIMYGPEEIT
jgi:hypothetical protein